MSILDRKLSDEERDAVILEMKERKITQQVTQQITQQVTQQITQQVTQQITQQDIKDIYDLLVCAGQSTAEAIDAIANKKKISVDEIKKIIKG